CGSGLAMELARLRGAVSSGIDASPRLIATARDRNPDSDIRVGDMQALPWDDATFDVVTSFRGIWGTTPDAVEEAHRVLVPGGRLAMTGGGNVGKSPGGRMRAPSSWLPLTCATAFRCAASSNCSATSERNADHRARARWPPRCSAESAVSSSAPWMKLDPTVTMHAAPACHGLDIGAPCNDTARREERPDPANSLPIVRHP